MAIKKFIFSCLMLILATGCGPLLEHKLVPSVLRLDRLKIISQPLARAIMSSRDSHNKNFIDAQDKTKFVEVLLSSDGHTIILTTLNKLYESQESQESINNKYVGFFRMKGITVVFKNNGNTSILQKYVKVVEYSVPLKFEYGSISLCSYSYDSIGLKLVFLNSSCSDDIIH